MKTIYYQSLASEIRDLVSKGIRKLVITSSGPREGKSTIAANLARALARSGNEGIVLVDTDWNKPTIHKIFGVENLQGLGEILKEVYQVEIDKANPNQFGLGDWIQLLRVQARTGRLRIAEDGQEFSILFHKGRISGIYWQQRPEDRRLGSLLVKAGRIAEEQKEAALRLQRGNHQPLGEIFYGLGHVEPADLDSPLKSQLKECLYRLLNLQRPEYLFSEMAEAYLPASTGRQPEILNGAAISDLIVGRLMDYVKQPFLSAQIPGYLKDTELENLKILTSGTTPYDLLDRVIAEQFKTLIEGLARRFDTVLIDSPPVAIASPAAILAALADGVILVVKSNGLDIRIIQQAKEALEKAKANLLGVVLNQVELEENKHLYYYYGAYRK